MLSMDFLDHRSQETRRLRFQLPEDRRQAAAKTSAKEATSSLRSRTLAAIVQVVCAAEGTSSTVPHRHLKPARSEDYTLQILRMGDEERVLQIRKRIEEFTPKVVEEPPTEEEVQGILAKLRELDDIEVDRDLLQSTRIGAALTKLSRSSSGSIEVLKETAAKLTTKWKDTLRRQATGGSEAEDTPLKRQKKDVTEGAAPSEPEYQYRFHGQDIRDKALVYIFKAFIAGRAGKYDAEKVGELSYEIECGLFDRYLGNQGNQGNQKDYTLKLKSIAFNLRDPKNTTFGDKIYNGEIAAAGVAGMESADMASDEKKKERSNILQESLEACQSDWAVKNILMSKDGKKKGQFKCFKCNSSDTVYYQMQTRSSDEPMTTFVTCLQCSNRWKF
ncbi:transcription elongation factor S-II, putative [Babesia caballi]|uniref:Transcription elongation factor S-II, putative n=1 Tax=Babesia caballi TaxID=5871 RepID=A0AAV4LWI5_BABCB|nr:transcription elongation factor S-II, putative [Babesia caballi]